MTPKESKRFRWESDFFSLTKEYLLSVHTSIFDLVHIGRFDHDELYSMPVPLRNFYYDKLVKHKKREEREMEKASGVSEATPSIRR